jgi:hypothetical protein
VRAIAASYLSGLHLEVAGRKRRLSVMSSSRRRSS